MGAGAGRAAAAGAGRARVAGRVAAAAGAGARPVAAQASRAAALLPLPAAAAAAAARAPRPALAAASAVSPDSPPGLASRRRCSMRSGLQRKRAVTTAPSYPRVCSSNSLELRPRMMTGFQKTIYFIQSEFQISTLIDKCM